MSDGIPVQALVNGCYTPIDSAYVRMAIDPEAVDDLDYEIEPGGLLTGINVLDNDTYDWDDFTVLLETPIPGLEDLGQGQFEYKAQQNNGYVNFIYKLCSATLSGLVRSCRSSDQCSRSDLFIHPEHHHAKQRWIQRLSGDSLSGNRIISRKLHSDLQPMGWKGIRSISV